MYNKAAVKTYEELRSLEVRDAYGYFQKLSEFIKETKTSFCWRYDNDKKEVSKLIETNNAIYYLIKDLMNIKANGGKITFIGNGGSAGIAIHSLADYANAGGFKTADFYNPALITCMSNDYGYEKVFEEPITMFIEPGDMLFAISSSGRSPNIVRAAVTAKERGCIVITFSGFEANNPLRSIGNLNFYTPSTHYGFVELSHQVLIHCILDLFVRYEIYEEERESIG